MLRLNLVICVLFLITGAGLAQTTWYVPDDFPAGIQAAISDPAVVNGDTIIVRAGTYAEHVDFLGKAITVKSEQGPEYTVIEGDQIVDVVAFINSEDQNSVLEGFTVTNGARGIFCGASSPTVQHNTITLNISDEGGAGIRCTASYAHILHNRITHNSSWWDGGGIECRLNAKPLIEGNLIAHNYCRFYGGGIECNSSSAIVNNNIIANNTAEVEGGGGIDAYSPSGMSHPYITNNTIYGNVCPNGQGGGILLDGVGMTVSNTILWNNSAPVGPEISLQNPPCLLNIEYSAVMGGLASIEKDALCILNWGSDMIDDDPMFSDPVNDDFHLTWLSPCINRGTNDVDLVDDVDGDPRPYMGTVDMGADEFTGVHALEADCFELPETGGVVQLALDAQCENGGRWYLIVGGVTGTVPGRVLPGGLATLPVNFDDFTFNVVFPLINSWVLPNFSANLGPHGKSLAQIVWPGPSLPPGSVGVVMHFAYLLGKPWEFVSNPIAIEIVP